MRRAERRLRGLPLEIAITYLPLDANAHPVTGYEHFAVLFCCWVPVQEHIDRLEAEQIQHLLTCVTRDHAMPRIADRYLPHQRLSWWPRLLSTCGRQVPRGNGMHDRVSGVV